MEWVANTQAGKAAEIAAGGNQFRDAVLDAEGGDMGVVHAAQRANGDGLKAPALFGGAVLALAQKDIFDHPCGAWHA